MSAIQHFLIGSSTLVLVPFYYTVYNIEKQRQNDKNYSFESYLVIAPLYLGLMNILKNTLNINPFLFGLISGNIVYFFAKFINSYNFTQEEWNKYYFRIVFKHTMTFGFLINFLETLI